MILSLGACRIYSEPTAICNAGGLRRERYWARSRECAGKRGEDAEVGMERDLLDATEPENDGEG